MKDKAGKTERRRKRRRMERVFETGRLTKVVSKTDNPAERLAFACINEAGVEFEVFGKTRLVKDKGYLCLSIVSADVAKVYAAAQTDFTLVTDYKPLMAYCAANLKRGNFKAFARGKVALPTAFKADAILKECGVPVPCVGTGNATRIEIDYGDSRMAKYRDNMAAKAPFDTERAEPSKEADDGEGDEGNEGEE